MKLNFFDSLYYYFITCPKDYWNKFRTWFVCNGKNKYSWKLAKYDIFNSYPWDEIYMFKSLKLQIEKSRHYFINKAKYASEERKKEIIRYQTIAIKLLHILINTSELYVITKDGKYQVPSFVSYANIQNVNRFTNNNDRKRILKQYPDELYILKARKLFYKIMDEKSCDWWY